MCWVPLELEPFLQGEVSRGEKMLYAGTDPASYITEYTSVYEDKKAALLVAI